MQTPLTCIGHACHDLHKEVVKLGGTVSYASIFGSILGAQTQVITAFGDNFQFINVFKDAGIELHNLPSDSTTCFQNTQGIHGREQILFSRASTITHEFVSKCQIHEKGIVHLGPIANEVAPSIASLFPNCTVGFSIQGWLRRWKDNGLVYTESRDWKLLKDVQIVFASEEDINFDLNIATEIASHVSIFIVTKGNNGAEVYCQNEVSFFPSFPVKEAGTTGAGDVFALGFLWSFHHSGDISKASIFAHSLASLLVEGHDLVSPPKSEQIANRIHEYKLKFNL